MTESRRVRIEPELKCEVPMASLCEQTSTDELARENNMNPSQVVAWKR